MSLYIKGLDMPKSCSECPCNYDDDSCGATGSFLIYPEYLEQRYDDCPLIEIVTCKDCRYCEIYALSNDMPTVNWCHRFSTLRAVESDGFCSYGERRADEKSL